MQSRTRNGHPVDFEHAHGVHVDVQIQRFAVG